MGGAGASAGSWSASSESGRSRSGSVASGRPQTLAVKSVGAIAVHVVPGSCAVHYVHHVTELLSTTHGGTGPPTSDALTSGAYEAPGVSSGVEAGAEACVWPRMSERRKSSVNNWSSRGSRTLTSPTVVGGPAASRPHTDLILVRVHGS